MSDWIRTKAGLQMAETITRYLPRITACLEEIAKEQKVKKIFYTEVASTAEMSYVLTKDIEKIGKKLNETKDYGPPYGPHNPQGNQKEKNNEQHSGT